MSTLFITALACQVLSLMADSSIPNSQLPHEDFVFDFENESDESCCNNPSPIVRNVALLAFLFLSFFVIVVFRIFLKNLLKNIFK